MTTNLPRPALVSAAAETGALYIALKARCPGAAFLTAHELIVQLQLGGTLCICRHLLDQLLDASGDAADRAGWRLAIFRIEQALGLDHHTATAAAQAAKASGPNEWASYVRDLRTARPVTAEG